MNVLFLTLLDFENIEEHNIYTDLLRKFYREGHSVYVVSPVERRRKRSTQYLGINEHLGILKLKIGNIQKTNIIEKGISTVTLEQKFIRGIKKYYSDIKFDLVLYSTPPITLQKTVKYVKNRDQALTYLMLKDIFPQNAVDMGMLSKRGFKGILYQYFRAKEKNLYRDSDYIGCMSQANVDYVLKNNPEISSDKVEICPNCIEIAKKGIETSEQDLKKIKEEYGILNYKKIFVYGGNLGKPQGIDFIIKCIQKMNQLEDAAVLIVGSGTEYHKLESAISSNNLSNVKLYPYLPKHKYDELLQACDVGLLFLDYRFTIPNFPSRVLSYMDAGLPVLAVTDRQTDIGEIIKSGQFGWACDSNDADAVIEKAEHIIGLDIKAYGKNARMYLEKHYGTDRGYNIIMSHFQRKE